MIIKNWLLAVAFLVGATTSSGQTADGFGSGSGGFGMSKTPFGVTMHAELARNGAAPSLDVAINVGYTCGLRVVASYDGKEMWSLADIDSTAASMKLLAPAAGDRRDRWNYHYDFAYPDDADAYAFDGDAVSIYVWVYDAANAEVSYTTTITFDIPGTIKHAVIASDEAGISASAIYSEYTSFGATEYTYGDDGTEDLPIAWVNLNRTDWDGVNNYGANNVTILSTTPEYTLPNVITENHQVWLVRCPIEDVIPDGATIIDSRWNCANYAGMYMAHADSLVAVLNTITTDNVWWDGNTGGWNNEEGCTMSSYKYQKQGYDDTVDAGTATTLQGWGAPSVSRDAWVPTIDNRTRYWDWGDYWQFTSEPHATYGFDGQASGQRFVDGDWYGWKINRLVQRANDGAANNGILYFCREGDTVPDTQQPRHPGAAAIPTELPFYTVSWIEDGEYAPVLPDAPDGAEAECIFVFSSDDGLTIVQDAFTDVFAPRGESYTLYIQQHHIGLGGAYERATAAELRRYRARGMEIGTHGFRGYQMENYDTTGVGASLWSTPDELIEACTVPTWVGDFGENMKDLSQCWMYDSTLGLGPEYLGDPLVGKTHSTNNGTTTLPTLLASNRNLLLTTRRLSTGNAYVDQDNFPDGDWYDFYTVLALPDTALGVTPTDTTYAMFPVHNCREPFNYQACSNTVGLTDVVGYSVDSPDEATVKAAVYNRITALVGRNIRLFSLYAHDNKNTTWYTTGITVQELTWILEVMDELNIPVMNIAAYSAWRKTTLVPWYTPESWGHWDPDGAGSSTGWRSQNNGGMWGRMTWETSCKLQGIRRQGS